MAAQSSEFQVVRRKGGKKIARNVAAVSHGKQLEAADDDIFDISTCKKRLSECIQEIRLTELLEDCAETYLNTIYNGYLIYQAEFQHLSYEDIADHISKHCILPVNIIALESRIRYVLKEYFYNLASVIAVQNETPLRFNLCDDRSATKDLNRESWPNLLSYGIGRFSSCPIARYQLAFLLVLREKLKSPVCHVYDPVFSTKEKEVLEDLGCNVISHNEEGKHLCDSLTVLFMPHCGKALYNNIIWANLNTLSNLAIIGNSFSRMLESTPHRLLSRTASYVIKVAPYMEETPLKSGTFVHSDVFNDLSLHVFPLSKLKTASSEFWENNTEPSYDEEEVEIIRKEDFVKEGS